MAELKTRKTKQSVAKFLNRVAPKEKRDGCFQVVKLMRAVTRAKPAMWGPSIVGFGSYTLKYRDGRELDWPLAAFSPRTQNITVYLLGLRKQRALLAQLGKHKAVGCCLHIQRVADVRVPVLKRMITESVRAARRQGA